MQISQADESVCLRSAVPFYAISPATSGTAGY